MDLKIVPVTEENRAQAEELAVAPGQEHFIEPVRECMEEADALGDWEPVCISDGETPIGFSMYGYMRGESCPRVWFDRLLIAAGTAAGLAAAAFPFLLALPAKQRRSGEKI